MSIRPILSSLRKHRIPAFLIVLEITLACAVMLNAVFLIAQRVASMHLANAIDQQGIVVMKVNGRSPDEGDAVVARDLAVLRGIAGVQAVAAMNSLPLTTNAWESGLASTPARKDWRNASQYLMTAGGETALGLHLLRGRFFTSEEYADASLDKSYHSTAHVVIITRAFADQVWPGQDALGKVLYAQGADYTVVGVVANVLAPSLTVNGGTHWYASTFFPIHPGKILNDYVLRSAPGQRQCIIHDATDVLSRLEPGAVISGTTYGDIRDDYFADTTSMIWMLVLVCVVMLAVTAVGIVGLSSFWVTQRRSQIGIRRTLGARRRDILHYFQTENFLLVTVGIVLGMGLAFGLNLYLMSHYELPRMPWIYFPVGALALWLLGQLAVLGPALRASHVPPVVATRSA